MDSVQQIYATNLGLLTSLSGTDSSILKMSAFDLAIFTILIFGWAGGGSRNYIKSYIVCNKECL